MMVKVTEREHSLSILQMMSVHYKCRTEGCYVKQAHLGIKTETSCASTKSLLHSHSSFWNTSRLKREFIFKNCEYSDCASCGRRRMTLFWLMLCAIKYIQLLWMYFGLQHGIWIKWVRTIRRNVLALIKVCEFINILLSLVKTTIQTRFNIINLLKAVAFYHHLMS